jgi:hypothetical protein
MYTIGNKIGVQVESEMQLPGRPRFLITDTRVLLTVKKTPGELNNQLASLVGSKEEWLPLEKIDTLGFNANTGNLELLSLYYPEINKVPASFRQLNQLRVKKGILRLDPDAPRVFQIEPFPFRYYNAEDNLLLCFNDHFTNAVHLEELRPTADISLYFLNGSYCAWGLHHADRYIASAISEEPLHESSGFLREQLKKSLEVITAENVELMDEKDLSILERIAEIHNKILTSPEYPKNNGLHILKNWLFDIADKFYDRIDLYFNKDTQ